MQLRAEKLNEHLAQGPQAIYLISGDETLLCQEAADAVRASARDHDFTEREVFDVDTRFNWQQVLTEAQSPSLFAERKILELRVPNGKPGREGGRFFEEYCAALCPDNLLLLLFPKLDKGTRNTAWFKTLDRHGVIVQTWPVTPEQLPRWITQRLRGTGIKASDDAVRVLAERAEGNLLAAKQEIEKLQLLVPEGGSVDSSSMSSLISDSARYDVFVLVDRALTGDAAAAARTLRGLRDEGTEAAVVLWALSRELRILGQAAERCASGENADQSLKALRVWDRRLPLMRQALRRTPPQQLALLLRQAGGVDRAIKGLRKASVWDELLSIVLSLAGANPIHPRNLRLGLSKT